MSYIHFFIVVNNNEISLIQYNYLCLWKQNPEMDHIYARDLFQAINIEYRKIFQNFFVPNSININLIVYIDEIVDYNDFFCFFCGMCFSVFERLVKVSLSACGIHSNVGLSKSHIITLFGALSPTALLNTDIVTFIEKMYIVLYIN